MTYSQIEITFFEDMDLGTSISFQGHTLMTFQWVNTRYAPGQVEIGIPTEITGERTALAMQAAFWADYNTPYRYDTVVVGNKITIKSRIPSIEFSNFSNPYDRNIAETISNYEGIPFTLTSLIFSEATINPKCSHYKVTIETSVLTTSVTGTVNIPTNTNNPFSFELLRGQSFNITLSDGDGQTINIVRSSSQVPKALNVGNFDISITNSVGGSIITILPLVDYSLQNIEYSLDDENWQEEGQFNGILEGEYTLYVRDSLGCSFEYDFTIEGQEEITNVRLPYFLLPKSNSIRFANRINWGVCANYKNDDNTLSCESEVKKPYKHVILMQSCDIITTQFRSNYQENTVTVIRENGDEEPIILNQVTNNMGQTDKRDARKYNLGNGKTGIYFISGNIYDYVTDVVTGTYVLNGLMPYWGVVGNIITVDGLYFQIQDIIFDETVNADVAIIDNVYTGENTTAIVASVFNIENFEEWEFTIDFFNYLNETVQIRINSNDDTFVNLVQLSEVINTKIEHEDTFEIKYKNTINTDLNFSRGLECKLRLPFTRVDADDQDESENNKTDSTVILLDSTIYEADRFVFEPLVKQIMRQLKLALSHDTVTIRGVGYVKNDTFEVEGALEESNLYVVTASMLKTGSSFNSKTGQSDSIFAGENAEIIGLVESDSGFVKYN